MSNPNPYLSPLDGSRARPHVLRRRIIVISVAVAILVVRYALFDLEAFGLGLILGAVVGSFFSKQGWQFVVLGSAIAGAIGCVAELLVANLFIEPAIPPNAVEKWPDMPPAIHAFIAAIIATYVVVIGFFGGALLGLVAVLIQVVGRALQKRW